MPFDASLKSLLNLDPLAWATFLCTEPVLTATLVDTDASAIAATADKAIRVEFADHAYLIHLEPQASHDAELPERLHWYSTVLRRLHGLEVRSVVLLLRPSARATVLTGAWERRLPQSQRSYLSFQYEVISAWEQPLAPLLAGPLALTTLAPLTSAAQPRLEEVVQQVVTRVQQEAAPDQRDTIQTALFLLLGLLHPVELIKRLLQGVPNMEESTFYQLILQRGEERGIALGEQRGIALGEQRGIALGESQGRAAGARQTILRLARRKLGEPTPEQLARLEAIADLDRLEQIADRMFNDIRTWDDLLAEEPSRQ
jgi:predicted transposase YdaD